MSKNYFVLECLIVENDHYFVNVVILNKKCFSLLQAKVEIKMYLNYSVSSTEPEVSPILYPKNCIGVSRSSMTSMYVFDDA